MGIDLIKNLRYNSKSERIKFEIADGNMEPLRYYPITSKSNENFKEMNAEIPCYIIFGMYKPAGMSVNSVNIRYATYKSWELIENFIDENLKENSGDKVYDFCKLLKSEKETGETEDKAMNFFENKVAPSFWNFFCEKDVEGRHSVKFKDKYIAKLKLNYYDYPETYKYSWLPQYIGYKKCYVFKKLWKELEIVEK